MANNKISEYRLNITKFLVERQAFIIALLLACLFWFSTKLSKQLEYTVPVKINYILPDGKTFKKSIPNTLDVSFSGLGWNLFFLKSKVKTKHVNVAIPNIPSQVFNTQRLNESISITIGNGKLVVSSILPTELYFDLEEKVVKKIPVRLNKSYSLATGYSAQTEFKLFPDSVEIEGPGSKIRLIEHWNTDSVKYLDLKANVDDIVNLQSKTDSAINLSLESIKVQLSVEKATEKRIDVPVFVPENLQSKVKIIPSSVQLIFQTGLSSYDLINASDFRIELPSYAIDKLKDLPTANLKVARAPEKVSHIRMSPNEVEIYINEN